MPARTKPLLLGIMGAWTLLTAAAGWYAVSGALSAGSADREEAATHTAARATPQSAAAGAQARARDARAGPAQTAAAVTRPGTPQAPAVGAAAANGAAPRSRPPGGRVIPAPAFAQSAELEAGLSGNVSSLRGRDAQDAARTPPKGVVVLDPGHGRGDPGAVNYLEDRSVGITEAASNLRNAQLLRDELAALGYDVYLTRDDAGRGPHGDLHQAFIVNDLLWRVQLSAAVDADVYLALHGNGARVKSISGPETWYCGKHERGSENARLAAMIQRAMVEALHEYGYFPPDRGIMEDAARHHSGDFCQFVVTRETSVPAALLEFLFLSNEDDARVLRDDRSHVILARHLAVAIDEFLTRR
jgi:N-acetylmuramoyl-L-alanine amidase